LQEELIYLRGGEHIEKRRVKNLRYGFIKIKKGGLNEFS